MKKKYIIAIVVTGSVLCAIGAFFGTVAAITHYGIDHLFDSYRAGARRD